MTRLTLDISMSLDGFVAGPNPRHDPAARRGRREAPTSGRSRARRVPPRPRPWRVVRTGRTTRPSPRSGSELLRRRGHGPAHVQRRRGPVGAGRECGRLVGRRPALPRAGVRADPPSAGDGREAARHLLRVRHRRDRFRNRAGARGGGRKGRLHRRRRGRRAAVPRRPACSTRCRSTSRRCCSAAESGCSTTSAPTPPGWSGRG